MMQRLHKSMCGGLVFAVTIFSIQQIFSEDKVVSKGKVSSHKVITEKVDFNRDIRPILSNHCFQCHGPDVKKREGELRLDRREDAFADHDGIFAFVPKDLENSEAWLRVTSDDEDEIMPPKDSDKALSPKQIALIKRWISEGAKWEGHWAFLTPKRPAIPKVTNKKWPGNAIDHFILSRLEMENLVPEQQATKVQLIRRVTLDLTGLPPTIKEIDAFLADKSPTAYEKVVDRLLKSPRYAEHMARFWLDAARYGDTHGLHLDNKRSMWPYREWVIKAIQKNMPFDQFTTWQLAGDLLPNATNEQKVASGFNRCNVTTSEGGSIDEEYVVRYAQDRTETIGTVWMGLTLNCSTCHDHKYDPISQKDFYSMTAFFNSLTDRAMDGNALLPPPSLQIMTPVYLLNKKQTGDKIAQLRKKINTQLAAIKYIDPHTKKTTTEKTFEFVWIEDSVPEGAKAAGNTPWQFVSLPKDPVFSGKKATKRTASGMGQHYFTGARYQLKIGEKDKLFAYVYLDPKNPPKQIMLQFNDGTWEHRAFWGGKNVPWGKYGTASQYPMGPLPEAGKWVRLEVDAAKVGLKPGSNLNGWAFTQFDGTVYWDKAGIVSKIPQGKQTFESLAYWDTIKRQQKGAKLPKNIANAIKVNPTKRSAAQKETVRKYFLEYIHPSSKKTFTPLHQKITELEKKSAAMLKALPSTLISKEMAKPRETFILIRGQYDKRGDKVTRSVPEIFPSIPKGAPLNRLGFARWLVDPKHPLTARVTVNRYWQQYFGTGIVKTSEDFGSQGQWPSHPKLLDYLATEFVKSGWDVNHLQKIIVMSATYRQSSKVTPEKYQKDRQNRLLARGPRNRMDAEVIRDSALLISGLLVEKIGGPSVKPYQPAGLWKTVGYSGSNTVQFRQDKGQALYRRSMYTFWKRTSPPPSMANFDAPSRENCTVRRERTNTPLQALNLMNDIQFVEAARHFAGRIINEGGKTVQQRITFAFRETTARVPSSQEIQLLTTLYQNQLAEYKKDKAAAIKLINVGDSKPDAKLDPVELASWTMIANTLLNLDEFVTK